MKIIYVSENKMFLCEDGKISELPSERIEHYSETVRTIKQNKEWKNSGTGAQFTGVANNLNNSDENSGVSINGIAVGESGLIYTLRLGGMGGIYCKSIENPKAAEEHILTKMDTAIGELSLKDGRIAVSINSGEGQHISVSDVKGNFDEITGGDTVEENPSWSKTDDRIFCSTAGYARNEYGGIAAISPRAVMAIDLKNGSIDEIFSDEDTDYLKPRNDSYGNFYYIKQPYKVPETKEPLWKDILLFPIRIIKALVGFLNAFSVLFGGGSLRSGNQQRGDIKSKQKSDKELYFEGRLLEAEKNEKANAAKGDENPGIFPVSRVLVKVGSDGKETVVKRGVLDYLVLDDGGVICSNGRSLIHIKDGKEELLVKAKLAHSICAL